VGFRRDIIADDDRGDAVPQLGHFATEFMPDNAGRMNALLRPFIPSINVGIGATE
jgi:hypothetical protein